MAVTLKSNPQNIAKALWPGINAVIEQEMKKYVDAALTEIRAKIMSELHPAVRAFVEPAMDLETGREFNLVIDATFGRELDNAERTRIPR